MCHNISKNLLVTMIFSCPGRHSGMLSLNVGFFSRSRFPWEFCSFNFSFPVISLMCSDKIFILFHMLLEASLVEGLPKIAYLPNLDKKVCNDNVLPKLEI